MLFRSPGVRRGAAVWRQPPLRPASMPGPARFRFLNEEHEVRDAAGWNDPRREKLWLYQLHYFDDLVAEGAAGRTAWHAALIGRWIAENPPGQGNGWEPYPLARRIVNWAKWAWAGNALPPGAATATASDTVAATDTATAATTATATAAGTKTAAADTAATASDTPSREKIGICPYLFWRVIKGWGRLVETTWHPEFGCSLPNRCLEVRFDGPETVVDFSWK